MPRLQLQPPARFGFETSVQIYISHVNQGGHLDNAQLLTLVSEARVRFFQSLGWREGDVGGSESTRLNSSHSQQSRMPSSA